MTARRRTRLCLVSLLLATAVGASACGSRVQSDGADRARPAQSSHPAASSAVPTAGGAASSATVSSPSADARPVNPPPSSSPNCLSGTVQVSYPGSDNPLRSVCVHVGTRVEITLRGAPGYPWRAVVSDNPQAAEMTADSVSAGSVAATALALAPGTAVLSATTRPAADPSGPLTKRWQLVVTVVR